MKTMRFKGRTSLMLGDNISIKFTEDKRFTAFVAGADTESPKFNGLKDSIQWAILANGRAKRKKFQEPS